MYRLVVSDLDGTLLGPDHRLGDYTKSVLARLRATGTELVLASGRHFMDVRALAAQLGEHGCLITCNGAAVNGRDGRLVQALPLDPDVVGFLLRDPLFADVHINCFVSDGWLVAQPEPGLLRYHQESGFQYRVVDFAGLDRRDVLKVFYYGEHRQLVALEAAILERTDGRVDTTFSLPQTLEVMARGVSKGAALALVLEARGLGAADVIAFGDGLNDREMLALAGTGLLMANADPRLAADLPHLAAIGSNAEQAVARHLDALLAAGAFGAPR